MAAFEAAVALGYRYVETDTHATADGVLVAFHDDHLDRVTDRAGVIGELPWAEVAAAQVGEPATAPAPPPRGPAHRLAGRPGQHRPQARRRRRAAGRAGPADRDARPGVLRRLLRQAPGPPAACSGRGACTSMGPGR